MKNKLSYILRSLPSIAIVIVFMGSVCANYISYNYIEELEKQIDKRDSLINKLTVSNKLVEEYFNVSEDSITKKTIYTLKDEKKDKIIQTKTEYRRERVVEKTSFRRGDNTYTPEEFLSLVRDGDSVWQDKIMSIVEKYKSLAKGYNKLIEENKNLHDSLVWQKMALGLIKRNYDIDYSFWLDKGVYHVKLASDKADSAFILFPYFKHKMGYDEKMKSWSIKK